MLDDAPLPEYDISDVGVMVLCKPCERYLRLLRRGESVNINERTWSNMIEALSVQERKNMNAILDYLISNETINNAICRDLTGKSAPTVNRYLNRLCEVGILRKSGSTFDTIYTKAVEHERT